MLPIQQRCQREYLVVEHEHFKNHECLSEYNFSPLAIREIVCGIRKHPTICHRIYVPLLPSTTHHSLQSEIHEVNF